MASHVFVIDSTAHRTQIKTSPGTYLRDVLEQACKNKGINVDQYELKQGNRVLDLSLSIRLSGLSSGAKLDLVQSSRTPSVVSIALQLPESEENVRLTDKFPSNTALWQILRRFESGAAGQGQSTLKKTYNFTQRGIAQVQNGASGAGRMYYDMPVVVVLGRELGTLIDLQKTLGQLGLNKGNSLLRLSFRNTQQPIEEAMAEISQFFKEDDLSDTTNAGASKAQSPPESQLEPESKAASTKEAVADISSTSSPPSSDPLLPGTSPSINLETAKAEAPTPVPEAMETDSPTSTPNAVSNNINAPQLTSPDARSVSIFAPPATSTPQAARTAYHDTDYEPTLDHARAHQAALAARARPQRLLSDAETAELAQTKQAALARVGEIVVVVRMPDQSRVQGTFTRADTAASLYAFVRGLIELEDQPFVLTYMDAKARQVVMRESAEETLIRGLGLQNRTLVNFVWGDDAAPGTRATPCLKRQYREQAQVLKVENAIREEPQENVRPGPSTKEEPKRESKGRGDFEGKMKKFLGLSKK